jgi:hypothetical protein
MVTPEAPGTHGNGERVGVAAARDGGERWALVMDMTYRTDGTYRSAQIGPMSPISPIR